MYLTNYISLQGCPFWNVTRHNCLSKTIFKDTLILRKLNLLRLFTSDFSFLLPFLFCFVLFLFCCWKCNEHTVLAWTYPWPHLRSQVCLINIITLEGRQRHGQQRKCCMDEVNMNFLAYAMTARKGLLQKRLKRIAARSFFMLPPTTQSIKGLNWAVMSAEAAHPRWLHKSGLRSNATGQQQWPYSCYCQPPSSILMWDGGWEKVSFWSHGIGISSRLVSWCFEPCQPLRIISGLKTNSNPSPSYSAHRQVPQMIKV